MARLILPWRFLSAVLLKTLLILCGLLCGVVAAAADPILVDSFKIAGDASRVRLVMQFDGEPSPRWFLLRGPHRLVIDLPDTKLAIDPADLKKRGLVSGVRYGHIDAQTSRLILQTKGPFVLERVDILKNEGGNGHRMVADLVAATAEAFETALALQVQTTGSTSAPKADRLAKSEPPKDKRFTVVIDPGHGGIDGGAESAGGTIEKTITLAFGLELKAALLASGRYDVHMTRENDQFLRLDERVAIARQHGADLLISIHADTIRLKNVRGATVYTVSDKASDAEAEALAARENLSDQLAGIEMEEENREVADILVDLIRRETHSFSIRFARSLVGKLSNEIEMINNPHRSAGFRVLRAPDVPSVLLELGYLSNEKDEKSLRDSIWRGKAVSSIVDAVALFAEAKTGTGG
jgi:N-acetylmuramoyl-L-alanine amidase